MFKSCILFLVVLFFLQNTNAQSVGIGTSTPHSSAALDVTSTDKGFLLPLLSQTARLAIPNPADGLMVYDTSSQRFYQYQDGRWRFILNSEYWEQSSTSNVLYNLADSIGIGTSSPQQKLDVNGNIHATQNINVAGILSVTGSGQAATLSAVKTMSTNGTVVAMGSITGNNNLVIDNPSAILQLKKNGTSKAFVQQNGTNLQLGTNADNTTGNAYIQMNGDDVIQLDKNANLTLLKGFFESKEVGKMVIGNRVTRKYSLTENTNFLPVLYGHVFSDGFGAAVWPQTGTTQKISTGIYEIDTHRTDMSDFGVIVVTATGVLPRICVGRYIGNAKFRVEIFSLAGAHVNNDFYFLINDALN